MMPETKRPRGRVNATPEPGPRRNPRESTTIGFSVVLGGERRVEVEDAITAAITAAYMRGQAVGDFDLSQHYDAEIQSARERLNRLLGLRQYAGLQDPKGGA